MNKISIPTIKGGNDMRYLTAGESHGKALTAIIEGVPANLPITPDDINFELARRQKGHGRGGRMAIETDKVEILSGVRNGLTLGSPITLQIMNKDWVNWENIMSSSPGADMLSRKVTKPRPGHADLTGCIKYQQGDVRNILERSSARETAMRVAVGAVAKKLLKELDILILGHVVTIGDVNVTEELSGMTIEEIISCAENSPVRCADKNIAEKMVDAIDTAKSQGDSLGGIFEVIATGVPVGLGSYVHWDRKFDARLASALMSIQAIKGVEVGVGFNCARLPGSKVHDEIFYEDEKGFYHKTNRAGGIEGGMTNGEPVILRGAMKPIPTLYKPLNSVDLVDKQPFLAEIERSDACAVPAACVVGEAVTAWEISQVIMEKFGSDTLTELKERVDNFRKYVKQV